MARKVLPKSKVLMYAKCLEDSSFLELRRLYKKIYKSGLVSFDEHIAFDEQVAWQGMQAIITFCEKKLKTVLTVGEIYLLDDNEGTPALIRYNGTNIKMVLDPDDCYFRVTDDGCGEDDFGAFVKIDIATADAVPIADAAIKNYESMLTKDNKKYHPQIRRSMKNYMKLKNVIEQRPSL